MQLKRTHILIGVFLAGFTLIWQNNNFPGAAPLKEERRKKAVSARAENDTSALGKPSSVLPRKPLAEFPVVQENKRDAEIDERTRVAARALTLTPKEFDLLYNIEAAWVEILRAKQQYGFVTNEVAQAKMDAAWRALRELVGPERFNEIQESERPDYLLAFDISGGQTNVAKAFADGHQTLQDSILRAQGSVEREAARSNAVFRLQQIFGEQTFFENRSMIEPWIAPLGYPGP